MKKISMHQLSFLPKNFVEKFEDLWTRKKKSSWHPKKEAMKLGENIATAGRALFHG